MDKHVYFVNCSLFQSFPNKTHSSPFKYPSSFFNTSIHPSVYFLSRQTWTDKVTPVCLFQCQDGAQVAVICAGVVGQGRGSPGAEVRDGASRPDGGGRQQSHATVQGHQQVRTAAVDQGRLRTGHTQEPVRVRQIYDDRQWWRRYG